MVYFTLPSEAWEGRNSSFQREFRGGPSTQVGLVVRSALPGGLGPTDPPTAKPQEGEVLEAFGVPCLKAARPPKQMGGISERWLNATSPRSARHGMGMQFARVPPGHVPSGMRADFESENLLNRGSHGRTSNNEGSSEH